MCQPAQCATTPLTSPAATLLAKAPVLLAYVQWDPQDWPTYTNRDSPLGWSLARGLLGEGVVHAPTRELVTRPRPGSACSRWQRWPAAAVKWLTTSA